MKMYSFIVVLLLSTVSVAENCDPNEFMQLFIPVTQPGYESRGCTGLRNGDMPSTIWNYHSGADLESFCKQSCLEWDACESYGLKTQQSICHLYFSDDHWNSYPSTFIFGANGVWDVWTALANNCEGAAIGSGAYFKNVCDPLLNHCYSFSNCTDCWAFDQESEAFQEGCLYAAQGEAESKCVHPYGGNYNAYTCHWGYRAYKELLGDTQGDRICNRHHRGEPRFHPICGIPVTDATTTIPTTTSTTTPAPTSISTETPLTLCENKDDSPNITDTFDEVVCLCTEYESNGWSWYRNALTDDLERKVRMLADAGGELTERSPTFLIKWKNRMNYHVYLHENADDNTVNNVLYHRRVWRKVCLSTNRRRSMMRRFAEKIDEINMLST